MARGWTAAGAIVFFSIWAWACSDEGTKPIDEFSWSRWRGPNGGGISLESGWNPKALAGGPKILWTAKIGVGYSNVIVQDNRLYGLGAGKIIAMFCRNAETGKQIWRTPLEDFFDPQSTPATDGEFVYALSRKGILVCVNAQNGKVRWSKDITEYDVQKPYYDFAGSPVVEGNLVILCANTSGMALDKKTGNKVWVSARPPTEYVDQARTSTGAAYSTPVIYKRNGVRQALVSSWEGLYSVRPETGEIDWWFDWDTGVAQIVTDPLEFDDKVFFVPYENYFAASVLLDIKGAEPKPVWTNKDLWSQISSPVRVGDRIYCPQGGPQQASCSLKCIDAPSGKILWEENLDGEPVSLTAANGCLIILDQKGHLYIAQAGPAGYQEHSRCDIYQEKMLAADFKVPPVLYRGKIYCRNYFGDLICIDVRK
jgi:outer membrane protein assembly factor BamB